MEAQEIIVEVWKRKSEMMKTGSRPSRLILSQTNYQKLLRYKSMLGELPKPELDYLQKESLFGIPVYIDNEQALVVE